MIDNQQEHHESIEDYCEPGEVKENRFRTCPVRKDNKKYDETVLLDSDLTWNTIEQTARAIYIDLAAPSDHLRIDWDARWATLDGHYKDQLLAEARVALDTIVS